MCEQNLEWELRFSNRTNATRLIVLNGFPWVLCPMDINIRRRCATRFLTFFSYEATKTAEMATAGDKVNSNLPKGTKILASYVCLSPPFPVPPNTLVNVTITEVDNAEAMAATSYPLLLAGATISRVPIMEVQPKTAAKTEKKYRR